MLEQNEGAGQAKDGPKSCIAAKDSAANNFADDFFKVHSLRMGSLKLSIIIDEDGGAHGSGWTNL